MKSFVIMCGLPRSGKSTFVRELREVATENNDKIVIVSPDNIRYRLYGEAFNKEREKEVWETARIMIEEFLFQGFTVVLDATSITKEFRQKWEYLLDEETAGFICYIDTPKDICIERAKETNFPIEVIENMDKKFEIPLDEEGKFKVIRGRA